MASAITNHFVSVGIEPLRISRIIPSFAHFIVAAVWLGYAVAAGHAQQPDQQQPNQPADQLKPPNALFGGADDDRYWTTSWALTDIDLATVRARLKLFGFDIPLDLDGTATFRFQVGVPIDRPTNTRAYRFHGTLLAQDVQLDEVLFPQISATIIYEDGNLRLTDFSGRTGAGTFAGSATAAINPPGKFEANLQVEKLNLQPLVKLFGILSQQADLRSATGLIDGLVQVSGNVDDVNDFTQWNATGRLHVDGFSVGDSATYVIHMDRFALVDRRIEIPQVSVTSPQNPTFFLRGNGGIQLDAPQQFSVAVQANDLPTADFLGLYFRSANTWAEGKLDLKGTANGEWIAAATNAPAITADLLVAAPQFRVLGVDLGLLEHQLHLTSKTFELTPLFDSNSLQKRKIDSIKAEYSMQSDQIILDAVDARVFGGQLKGQARFSRTETGVHQIDAIWQDLVPSMQLPVPWLPQPVGFAGTTSGSIQWSVPADKVNYPAFHQGKATIKMESLKVDGEDLGSGTADLEIADANFRLQAEGDLLGGNVSLTSQSQLTESLTWNDVPNMMLGGSLIIRQLSVGDTLRIFSESPTHRYAGRLDGSIDFQSSKDRALRWQSDLSLRDLTIDRQSVSRLLTAKLSQADGVINVESIKGDYAAGNLQLTGQWALEEGNRVVQVRLVQAQGRLLLLPFSSSTDPWMDGLVSLRATITDEGGGPLEAFRLAGSARVHHGHLYGLPINSAHSSIRIRLHPSPLQWDVSLPSIHATLARGKVQGSLKASSHASGVGVDLDSRLRLTHVDFEDLLSNSIGVSTFGRGDMTGDITLSGKRIESLDDFRGRFRLTLAGTDATAVPGLSAAGSTLGALSLSGVRFTSGQAKGQIARGSVQIEDLTMLSDRLKVQAAGRVFLAGPRMDVQAVIETGNFQGQEILVRQIAPVALRSLTPLTSLNQWLSDRTFVVDLHGPVGDPQVRLLATETIQANVRHRLTRGAIGLIITDAAMIGK